MDLDPALEIFHPRTAAWFSRAVGRPTAIQARAWPRIAAGGHLLITAPTGSGKTLTAFLWALDRLVRGVWPQGQTSVLYVSPLKALNNDIRANLTTPLSGLKTEFAAAGERMPDIRVLTRSGDTPQSERQRMLRRPPEILITTPESLNLLLSSRGGRTLLTDLKTVILDEIHAVVGSKRGSHLITAVERLTDLSGPFQRLALSATVQPADRVAAFVGGLEQSGPAGAPLYTPRPVEVIRTEEKKEYRLQVSFPEEVVDRQVSEAFWQALALEFKVIIGRNRASLLFVNSRRLAEKLTQKINKGESGGPLAFAHHGSLSREMRTEVEAGLKKGRLKAIVATSSLEMGIDIGRLDEVILVQSPFSVSAAVQRIGRAGHGVGRVSRATLFPSHAHDFLEAAVLAKAVLAGDIEAVRPVEGALDVLAQVIISMTGLETWDLDELFNKLRTAWPYRNLSRSRFELVLNMLAGRYADTRLRELKPRVHIDRLTNTVAGAKGALLALYTSGGTIPDRGSYQLRAGDSGALIGDLDEEFVWEAKVGQTFLLGAQTWKIERITHNDVLVSPGKPGAAAAPFWKAEALARDAHFSGLIARFLTEAEDDLARPGGEEDLEKRLIGEHCLEKRAARQLIRYLSEQRRETGLPLPHAGHVVVEFVETGPGGGPGNQVVIHNFWGGRVNRPFAYALAAAWQAEYGHQLEVFPSNDAVALVLPQEVAAETLLGLVRPGEVEKLLVKRLESSGFFGARFREAAGRALLITRKRFNHRLPLWMSRLKSQKLLDAVKPYGDFPMALEAWRTCLQDEFDLAALDRALTGLADGSTQVSQVRSARPSPLARGLAWQQINRYMYMTDQAPGAGSGSLKPELLEEAVFKPHLRPRVDPELIARFQAKVQRTQPGYAPSGWRELADWVAERLLIPAEEWRELVKAMIRDHGPDMEAEIAEAGVRLVWLEVAETRLLAAREQLPRLAALWPGRTVRLSDFDGRAPEPLESSPEGEEAEELAGELLGQWLGYYGPLEPERLAGILALPAGRLALIIEDLIEARVVVAGELIAARAEASGCGQVCEARNFEILLRLARAGARPLFEPLEAKELAPFLARIQGLADLGGRIENPEGLLDALDRLSGLFLKVQAWEGDILPARTAGYQTVWLDSLMQTGGLIWLGRGRGRVALVTETDLDLIPPLDDDEPAPEPDEELIPETQGRYDFQALTRLTGQDPARLTEKLWAGVWAGELTNDSFAALRQGLAAKFQPPRAEAPPRLTSGRGRRSTLRRGFQAYKSGLAWSGNWRRVAWPPPPEDTFEADELARERARLLLDRYGVLFRELLTREDPALSWPRVFRALRLMELAGEVLAGHFFKGPTGPQFATPAAFRSLAAKRSKDRPEEIFWLNATDPASLCGLGLEPLKSLLPRRLDTSHLVYRGAELVLISERLGRSLIFHTPAEDPRLVEYLAPLNHLLSRSFNPLRSIRVESINNENPLLSPYLNALQTVFDVVSGPRDLVLYRNR